jgi:hypothetical protein
MSRLRKHFPFTDFATLKILRFMSAFSCPVLLDTPIADEKSLEKDASALAPARAGGNIG